MNSKKLSFTADIRRSVVRGRAASTAVEASSTVPPSVSQGNRSENRFSEPQRQPSVWGFFWLVTVFNVCAPLFTFFYVYVGIHQSAQTAAWLAIGLLWAGLGAYLYRAWSEQEEANKPFISDEVPPGSLVPSKQREKTD
jgi:hypothetical protein